MLSRWLLCILSAIYMQGNENAVIRMGPTLQQNSCVNTVRGTTGGRGGKRETEVGAGGLTCTCRPSGRFLVAEPTSQPDPQDCVGLGQGSPPRHQTHALAFFASSLSSFTSKA